MVLCRRGAVAKGLVTVASVVVCSCGSVAGARACSVMAVVA